MRGNLAIVLFCLAFLGLIQGAPANAADQSITVVVNPSTLQRTTPDDDADNELPVAGGNESQGIWPEIRQAFAPAWPRPIRKVKPPYRPVTKCSPLPGPVPCATCILPRTLPGQWEMATQVFFARINGTLEETTLGAGAGFNTEIDFTDDLALPAHEALVEYSGRYQFRPRWAMTYSIMTQELEGSGYPSEPFYLRSWFFPTTTPMRTRWELTYQKVGLQYHTIYTPTTIVSITGSWLYFDQRFRVFSTICGDQEGIIDRTRNMATSGIQIQRCCKTLPNGATFSSDHRIDFAYLDDTFGIDLQVGGRFSVPMGFNRWGYVRGGYRWIDFNEDRDDLRLDSTLEGGFVELGLIF